MEKKISEIKREFEQAEKNQLASLYEKYAKEMCIRDRTGTASKELFWKGTDKRMRGETGYSGAGFESDVLQWKIRKNRKSIYIEKRNIYVSAGRIRSNSCFALKISYYEQCGSETETRTDMQESGTR